MYTLSKSLVNYGRWARHKVQGLNSAKVSGGGVIQPKNFPVLRQRTLQCCQHCKGPFRQPKREKTVTGSSPGNKAEENSVGFMGSTCKIVINRKPYSIHSCSENIFSVSANISFCPLKLCVL